MLYWCLRSWGQNPACTQGFSKTLSTYPIINGYLTLLVLGKAKAFEGWHPTSVAPVPVQIASLTHLPHRAISYGNNLHLILVRTVKAHIAPNQDCDGT